MVLNVLSMTTAGGSRPKPCVRMARGPDRAGLPPQNTHCTSCNSTLKGHPHIRLIRKSRPFLCSAIQMVGYPDSHITWRHYMQRVQGVARMRRNQSFCVTQIRALCHFWGTEYALTDNNKLGQEISNLILILNRKFKEKSNLQHIPLKCQVF